MPLFQKQMKGIDTMNYRLIVEYQDTGIITEQYFPDADIPDTIIHYLDNVLENGAKLEYLLQQKTAIGIETINTTCCWCNLPKWRECGE